MWMTALGNLATMSCNGTGFTPEGIFNSTLSEGMPQCQMDFLPDLQDDSFATIGLDGGTCSRCRSDCGSRFLDQPRLVICDDEDDCVGDFDECGLKRIGIA